MRILVDNSLGDDAAFAEEVARELRAHDLEVDVKRPDGSTMFDTAVHNVAAGISIRVSERPDRATLATIETVVRGALGHRVRRCDHAVPVYLGDTVRAVAWIDVFG